MDRPRWAVWIDEADDGTFFAQDEADGTIWELVDPTDETFDCPDCNEGDPTCQACGGTGRLDWHTLKEDYEPEDWGWRVEPSDGCAWRQIK